MTFEESSGYARLSEALIEIVSSLFREVPGLLDYRAACRVKGTGRAERFTKEKGPSEFHERPKSREETPKEGCEARA